MLAFLSAFSLFVGSAAIAGGEAASCPGFEGGSAFRIEADSFYIDRALRILRAAEANDAASLSVLVADDARFEVWRGDYTSSARSIGPKGAIEMMRDVQPVRFEAQSSATGPFSIIPTSCAWEVDLLLRTSQPHQGMSVTFSFVDGQLISAIGNAVTLLEGNIR